MFSVSRSSSFCVLSLTPPSLFESLILCVCVCFFVQLCVGNVEMQAITGAKLRAILHYFSGVCVFRTANDVKWHAAHFSPKHYVDWNDRDTHSHTHLSVIFGIRLAIFKLDDRKKQNISSSPSSR